MARILDTSNVREGLRRLMAPVTQQRLVTTVDITSLMPNYQALLRNLRLKVDLPDFSGLFRRFEPTTGTTSPVTSMSAIYSTWRVRAGLPRGCRVLWSFAHWFAPNPSCGTQHCWSTRLKFLPTVLRHWPW